MRCKGGGDGSDDLGDSDSLGPGGRGRCSLPCGLREGHERKQKNCGERRDMHDDSGLPKVCTSECDSIGAKQMLQVSMRLRRKRSVGSKKRDEPSFKDDFDRVSSVSRLSKMR